LILPLANHFFATGEKKSPRPFKKEKFFTHKNRKPKKKTSSDLDVFSQ